MACDDWCCTLLQGWDDRGKGTLTVRQSKGSDDGTAGLTNIVFTMESGRIIVNGSVYKGLKTQKVSVPPEYWHTPRGSKLFCWRTQLTNSVLTLFRQLPCDSSEKRLTMPCLLPQAAVL